MDVLDLGLRDYAEIWEFQKELVEKRLSGAAGDTILLVEHPPVYTRGRSARTPLPPGLPYPVYDVERGGDVTFHGPGQLVGYPVFDLNASGLWVGTFIRRVESALIAAIEAEGMAAERLPGFTGVWSRGKKTASIGITVRGGVSYHGFALNVDMDLSPFGRIRPCKLESAEMSTLSRLAGRAISVARMKDRVIGAFQEAFAGITGTPCCKASP